MSRKLIAAIFALTMCAALVSCDLAGKGDGSEDTADSSIAAQKGSGGDDSFDEGAEAPAGVSYDAEFDISPENVVFTGKMLETMPTADEAAILADLALGQYRAANEGDGYRYIGLMNFTPVRRIMAEEVFEPDFEKIMSMQGLARNTVGTEMYYALYNLQNSEGKDALEMYEGKEAYMDNLQSAIDAIDVNDSHVSEALSKTAFGEIGMLDALNGIGEDTVVGVRVVRFDREGDDIFVDLNMEVFGGDNKYVMKGIYGWRVDGEWGILIGQAEVVENPCAGMTAQETADYIAMAEEAAEAEKAASTDPAAQAVYNAVMGYVTRRESTVGIRAKESLATDFDELTSDTGLDLGGAEPSAPGDKAVYEDMIAQGYDGVIRIIAGGENYVDKAFYTYPDGSTGEYIRQ